MKLSAFKLLSALLSLGNWRLYSYILYVPRWWIFEVWPSVQNYVMLWKRRPRWFCHITVDPESHAHQKWKSYKLSHHSQTNVLFRTWRNTEDFDYFHLIIVEPLWNKIIVWHFRWVSKCRVFWRTRFRIHRYVTAEISSRKSSNI